MADNPKAIDTLDKIISLMVELKQQLGTPNSSPSVTAQAVSPPVAPPKQQAPVEDLGNFESLKAALNSPKWPEAVNPHLICDPNSDPDKTERGRGIIELMVEEDLNGLKFLDYGCGEGHCAALSAEYKTALSVGYDSKSYDRWAGWKDNPNLLLTSDLQAVQEHGPYNVIVLFDVIDHLVGEEPTTVLRRCNGLLADGGRIYMRTHPFVSRHGTHLYHSLNKAYIHLVFSEAELKGLLPENAHEEPSIGVIAPIMTYEKFVKDAGLKIVNRRDITEKVEPFFKIPKIAERIINHAKTSNFPEFQMSLQFLDYILVKN